MPEKSKKSQEKKMETNQQNQDEIEIDLLELLRVLWSKIGYVILAALALFLLLTFFRFLRHPLRFPSDYRGKSFRHMPLPFFLKHRQRLLLCWEYVFLCCGNRCRQNRAVFPSSVFCSSVLPPPLPSILSTFTCSLAPISTRSLENPTLFTVA